MSSTPRTIAIITSGTRGDVQPFIALALGLRAAGHKVRLATHEEFRAWIMSLGLDFAPIAGDPRALLASEAGQKFLTPRNPVSFLQGARQINREVEQMLRQQMHDGLAIAGGSDALIFSFSAPLAIFVAEKLGIPAICAALAPISRTREFTPFILGFRSLGATANLLSHRSFELIAETLLRKNIRLIRGDHGMAQNSSLFSRLYDRDVLLLNAFSPKVVPPPRDWPASHPVTGYWTLPEEANYTPDPALDKFLSQGEPPIYVGFGSMVDRAPAELTNVVVAAAQKAGKRLLISRGWADLASGALPESVFAIGNVPHTWLFPRLSGVVHHGGAGTTAAALRAGVPSTVVPFGVDQPFWGWRVSEIGAGCSPIPRKKLSIENLASAFLRMGYDSDMKRTAAVLGEELRREDGIATAVCHIEKHMNWNPRV